MSRPKGSTTWINVEALRGSAAGKWHGAPEKPQPLPLLPPVIDTSKPHGYYAEHPEEVTESPFNPHLVNPFTQPAPLAIGDHVRFNTAYLHRVQACAAAHTVRGIIVALVPASHFWAPCARVKWDEGQEIAYTIDTLTHATTNEEPPK